MSPPYIYICIYIYLLSHPNTITSDSPPFYPCPQKNKNWNNHMQCELISLHHVLSCRSVVSTFLARVIFYCHTLRPQADKGIQKNSTLNTHKLERTLQNGIQKRPEKKYFIKYKQDVSWGSPWERNVLLVFNTIFFSGLFWMPIMI